MAELITTTLVVSFQSPGADGILKAEVDSREDGFNNGRTAFVAGDNPAYLVYTSDNVSIISQEPSTGIIQNIGPGTREITELVQFIKPERTSSPGYPVKSLTSFKWLGNNLGNITRLNDGSIICANTGVGVAKITYQTEFRAFRISNIPNPLNGETTYNIVVLITGQQT